MEKKPLYSIVLDTSNKYFFAALFKDDKVIYEKPILEIYELNINQHSEKFFNYILKLLEPNNLSLKDIKSIYLTVGPGSFTGIKLPIIFSKTAKTFKPSMNIYTINSTLFYAGKSNSIVILAAGNSKYFFGVYENTKIIDSLKVIGKSEVRLFLSKYTQYELITDKTKLNLSKKFIEVQDKFTKVKKIEDIRAKYLKII